MPREKRKTRLNKGESGDFIGFAAFAAPAASTLASSSTGSGQPNLSLSPVYMGSDSELSLTFQRIGQKRDATTKTKALIELRDFFADDAKVKKMQVDALCHYCYLYHSKLHYENTASVRASSLECLSQASKRLPKAWKTLMDQQPEILGMIFCCRADPAADVRFAASTLVNNLVASFSMQFSEGVWDYTKRILSYGKAKSMHEELFQKKDTATTLTEKQKEDLEERFERIVGTALGGMQTYLHHQQEGDGSDSIDDTRFLWKSLASQKPALRRKTYGLLATVCQKAPSLIDKDKISKLISQSLSSEKEPSNIQALLETLVSFVASFQQDDRSNAMGTYTKPIAKLFKKGCHGATQWTPTVLPIVALIPLEEQASVLTCVWEGRVNMAGLSEELEVVSAVAETASFLLLKDYQDFSDIIATCWLKSLQTFLATEARGPAQVSLSKLCDTLSTDWEKLSRATVERPTSAVHHLNEWFWTAELQKILLHGTTRNSQLTVLTKKLQSDATHLAQGATALKQKFHNLLSSCQESSGSVPTADVYELWLAIFPTMPLNELFDDIDINKFILNDILRWMIIHTSSISERADKHLVKYDFSLLCLCQPLMQANLWDSLLKELFAARCDLGLLTIGLNTMLYNGIPPDVLKSKLLDEYCVQVAMATVANATVLENDSEGSDFQEKFNETVLDFLTTCAGLGQHAMLITEETLHKWVEGVYPSDSFILLSPNPVLEVLSLLVASGRLSEASTQKVMLQNWRQGGVQWQKIRLVILEREGLLVQLVDSMSSELKAIIKHRPVYARDNGEWSTIWSERAIRMLNLCQSAEIADRKSMQQCTLSEMGLADDMLWVRNKAKGPNSFITLCLLHLLQGIPDATMKRSLFWNLSPDSSQMFVKILLGLSAGHWNPALAGQARMRQDPCSQVLNEIHAASADNDQKQEWCNACVDLLASMIGERDELDVCRGIAVLSQLTEVRFRSICDGRSISDDELKATEVKKGDIVWYITDARNPVQREKCTVAKVHSDLPGDLYFSIEIKRDGGIQERQTVKERLRMAPYKRRQPDKEFILLEDISSDEKEQRMLLQGKVLRELIVPNWENEGIMNYELVSILISQCGILGPRGIGTDHYLILQKLMSLQGLVCTDSCDETESIAVLHRLSLAMGYGFNIPSFFNQRQLGFDPTISVTALVKAYDDIEREKNDKFDLAAALWLTDSASTIDSAELRQQTFWLLFRVASQLLETETQAEGLSSEHFVALRAIECAQKESHKFRSGESILEDSEAEALTSLIRLFVRSWGNEGLKTFPAPPTWSSTEHFDRIFKACLSSRKALLAQVSRRCIDDLIKCLADNNKRYYAVALLSSYAEGGVPLHDDVCDLNEETSKRLDVWCAGLVNEEIEDLEDDVDAVAQWIPTQLMNDVEGWFECEDDFVTSENEACARFLSWIIFCQIAEAATSNDSVNRQSFVAYTTKCKAVNAIMNLAIVYGNIGTDRKIKFAGIESVEDVINTDFNIAKLAAIAIFTSIDIFPGLTKNWWEMQCPKFASQSIKDFVEQNISPKILQRELRVMKTESSFGDMNVQGHVGSREITATYIQDEITLSVVIKLPPSFPLRRAEVDCSKTFGVPLSRSGRWSLQISQILNNLGGTLSAALLRWKENVDKEFEGVEACPICFSVLHVKCHKLPGVECNTCHNRYHMECLSEWFRTSGKNTCVICQQPWSGTRIQ